VTGSFLCYPKSILGAVSLAFTYVVVVPIGAWISDRAVKGNAGTSAKIVRPTSDPIDYYAKYVGWSGVQLSKRLLKDSASASGKCIVSLRPETISQDPPTATSVSFVMSGDGSEITYNIRAQTSNSSASSTAKLSSQVVSKSVKGIYSGPSSESKSPTVSAKGVVKARNWKSNGNMRWTADAQPVGWLKLSAKSSAKGALTPEISVSTSARVDAVYTFGNAKFASSTPKFKISNLGNGIIPGTWVNAHSDLAGLFSVNYEDIGGSCDLYLVATDGTILEKYSTGSNDAQFEIALLFDTPLQYGQRLMIIAPGALSKIIPITDVWNNSNPIVTIKHGDTNGDNIINGIDLGYLQTRLGMNEQMFDAYQLDLDFDLPEFQLEFEKLDVVRDGVLNALDYNAILANFGTGDQPGPVTPLRRK
jgi:hypothetical protein